MAKIWDVIQFIKEEDTMWQLHHGQWGSAKNESCCSVRGCYFALTSCVQFKRPFLVMHCPKLLKLLAMLLSINTIWPACDPKLMTEWTCLNKCSGCAITTFKMAATLYQHKREGFQWDSFLLPGSFWGEHQTLHWEIIPASFQCPGFQQ